MCAQNSIQFTPVLFIWRQITTTVPARHFLFQAKDHTTLQTPAIRQAPYEEAKKGEKISTVFSKCEFICLWAGIHQQIYYQLIQIYKHLFQLLTKIMTFSERKE